MTGTSLLGQDFQRIETGHRGRGRARRCPEVEKGVRAMVRWSKNTKERIIGIGVRPIEERGL